ncbi:hypothetical protein [Salipiger sp. HF18]|uniref:hypothetical protein n=1 Tax=Salipiger sp. HF18 TaxID=2721557 RepID=UPI0020CAA2F2|nr:hypothetical protein [Salipiger sp. HF18]
MSFSSCAGERRCAGQRRGLGRDGGAQLEQFDHRRDSHEVDVLEGQLDRGGRRGHENARSLTRRHQPVGAERGHGLADHRPLTPNSFVIWASLGRRLPGG